MIFSIICFIAAETTLDIAKDSIIIENINDPKKWSVTMNEETKEYDISEKFIITGTSTNHNIHILFESETSELNLEFKDLNVKTTNNSFLSVKGKNQLNLNIAANVEIQTTQSDVFYLIDSAKLVLSITEGAKIINPDGSYMISGLGEIQLASIKGKFGGICGTIISVADCDLELQGSDYALGGLNVTSITIIKSKISAKSHKYAVIGGGEGFNSIEISLKDSTLNVSMEGDGTGVGGGNALGKLTVENCVINVKTISEIETFSSGIGGVLETVIRGSKITARATKGTAIGGGNYVKPYNATMFIYDSELHAKSTGDAPAIGSGFISSNRWDQLFIQNCTIVANVTNTTFDKRPGAAVGAGYTTQMNNITILDSKINAVSQKYSAAIGAGCYYSKVKNITIRRSQIYGLGIENGAGVGGGYESGFDVLEITESYINGSAIGDGAGIGCGGTQPAERIIIKNSNITALSGVNGAGIGGSNHGRIDIIDLYNCTIFAFAGATQPNEESTGAGIGGGNFINGGNITIKDCKIRAIAGYAGTGAGIGGGVMGSSGHIKINNSDIVAISSLNGSAASTTGGGGSGIGFGGGKVVTGCADNNGTITITYSNISAFGSNIYTEGTEAVSGAGIGYGGILSHPRYPTQNLTILFENSIIYAYGGNTTREHTSANAGLIGGDIYNETRAGRLTIKNCFVYAVNGYSTKYNSPKAVYGVNFDNTRQSFYGEMLVTNSTLIGKINDKDDASIGIIINTLKFFGNNTVELHSTNSTAILAYNKTTMNPIVEISGLKKIKATKLEINEKSYDISANGDSIAFSVPQAGEYGINVYVENKKQTLFHDKKVSTFKVENGFNSFTSVSVSGSSNKQGLTIALSVIVPVVAIVIIIVIFFVVKTRKANKEDQKLITQSLDA